MRVTETLPFLFARKWEGGASMVEHDLTVIMKDENVGLSLVDK